jgi:L-ascorbate metabolism protein UlaG (beta-lactamase superfamily)
MNRRKFLKYTVATGTILTTSGLYITSDDKYKPMITSFTSNPKLKTILPPERWKGTPVDEKGLFANHEFPFWPKFGDVWKWQTTANPDKTAKKTETFKLQIHKGDSWLTAKEDMIVWLGHASYFIRLAGKTLLIDPVLGDLSFMVKRISELPVAPEKLANMDYILLSHDHRDHADEASMKLIAPLNKNAKYLTSLKLDTLLGEWTGSKDIQAAGWYQEYETDESLKITFVPTRHWCRRGLTDTNQILWGGFVIQGAGKTIYFGGDTGYGSHLKEVKEIFGEIDFYLVGVGAYKPEWFMSPSHMSPQSAVKAANEMEAKTMIPMHYGTFDLSDEPTGEPYRILQDLEKSGKIKGKLHLAEVGEVIVI